MFAGRQNDDIGHSWGTAQVSLSFLLPFKTTFGRKHEPCKLEAVPPPSTVPSTTSVRGSGGGCRRETFVPCAFPSSTDIVKFRVSKSKEQMFFPTWCCG